MLSKMQLFEQPSRNGEPRQELNPVSVLAVATPIGDFTGVAGMGDLVALRDPDCGVWKQRIAPRGGSL